MGTTRSIAPVAALAALAAAARACGGESAASCADLRAELASITPTAEQAWDDIGELQDATTRALALEAEIAERCS